MQFINTELADAAASPSREAAHGVYDPRIMGGARQKEQQFVQPEPGDPRT
jgi:hypothetical protein